ncbi:hemerythrin domain-containing protein [Geobacter grbiciae]|uniref:hemerythrin domain-containing protein n=1 Tax=Geobacter grbiciae TaxID=155042 RepID=UPI001C009547|nr:hemerythrin domain-containing protein [Geobacter grbiciae]MBT1077088.1 hemerythrin domain-containing protein [Geobacter grbiciae]
MKRDITQALVEEHRLILRMLALLERNAPLTAAGRYANFQFFRDAVDFIRSYADRFHHAKEEEILFEALITNGMPRENSPVAAMLMEHDQGRAYVKAMEEAALAAEGGDTSRTGALAENARAYLTLLREHIDKEDTILYPLAERIIPEGLREGIVGGYEAAEARTPAGFAEHYLHLVEQYEAEATAKAA